MKRFQQGFTLVEVSLFLAITGLLFVGIVAGVQNSMFQQRYNDSVQSFAEFLRSIYSQVSNVQNSQGTGRSNQAIYGRIVSFENDGDQNKIYAYDVVGDADDIFSSNITDAIENLQVDDSNVEEYKPRWLSAIQETSADQPGNEPGLFTGSLLIVRHPRSGTVFTLFSDNTVSDFNSGEDNMKNFRTEEVNFCINPNGNQPSDSRRNIRIAENARNASGVEIMNQDSADNECNQGGGS